MNFDTRGETARKVVQNEERAETDTVTSLTFPSCFSTGSAEEEGNETKGLKDAIHISRGNKNKPIKADPDERTVNTEV